MYTKYPKLVISTFAILALIGTILAFNRIKFSFDFALMTVESMFPAYGGKVHTCTCTCTFVLVRPFVPGIFQKY